MTEVTAGVLTFFVVIAIGIAYMFGYWRARDLMRQEIAEASREAERLREFIEANVRDRSDEQLDKDLAQWLRD